MEIILFQIKLLKKLTLFFLLISIIACEEKSSEIFEKIPTGQNQTTTTPPVIDNPNYEDIAFNAGTAFNSGTVYKILRDDTENGSIYVGGTFTSFQNTLENRIIKVLSSGAKDQTFSSGTGFNGDVLDICKVKDKSEDIIVTGKFTQYNGVPSNYIIRLNSDGSIDQSLNIGTGFNGQVSKALCLDSGEIIVVGSFTEYNTISANKIIALNSDGSVSNKYSFGQGFNSSAVFYALTKDSNNNLYIGGQFNSYNSETVNNYIKIKNNGVVDLDFTNAIGFNNLVLAITIVDNGIVFGGLFTKFNGSTFNQIIKLDLNGEVDTDFDIGTGFNTGGVFTILPSTLDQNILIVAGLFDRYDGQATPRVALLRATTGAIISEFQPTTGANNTVWTVENSGEKSGSIYLGGNFTKFNNNQVNRLTSIMLNGLIEN